ncbi:MAG: iron-containing alcohol dehydrogenase [Firmicutes bacterium]|nr:iron-containing alcohol dehydrogenase [Bacillota bacterium]
MYYGKMNFSVSQRGDIHFGCGQADKTGEYVKEFGIDKIFLLTDKGVRAAGLLEGIEASLKNAGVAYQIFDDIKSDAPSSDIDLCVKEAKAFGAEGVIALGGGSTLDSGKAVNAMLGNPGLVKEYFADGGKPLAPGKRLFTIPTTAGTGAECSVAAVINDVEEDRKRLIVSKETGFDCAIVDPLLTVGLPPFLTACTGIDTLAHAAEPYTNCHISEYHDPIFEGVIDRVGKFLERAYKNGNDIEARTQMSYAAMMAGLGMIESWCHMGHALAQTLGGFVHLHHGLICALALPHAMKAAAKYYPDRVKRIGQMMGFVYADDMTNKEVGEKALADFKSYNARFGIIKLSDYVKLTDSQIQEFAKAVPKDSAYPQVPGPYTEEEIWELVQDYCS